MAVKRSARLTKKLTPKMRAALYHARQRRLARLKKQQEE